jgi:choline dehydrogenase-like flavoprotein
MAKSSSVWTVIPEAEATGNCEIRSESYVFRVGMNDAGRATGVHYYDADRTEQFQNARAVVVCANGAETPKLLLNSANSAYPDGLANSSGKVGRYLMFQQGRRRAGPVRAPAQRVQGLRAQRFGPRRFATRDPPRTFNDSEFRTSQARLFYGRPACGDCENGRRGRVFT